MFRVETVIIRLKTKTVKTPVIKLIKISLENLITFLEKFFKADKKEVERV